MKFVFFFHLTNANNGHKVSPPLSVLACAAPLMRDGIDVVVVDARIEPDYERMVLEAMADADLLGVSSMTGYQIADGLKVSAAVKAKFPDKPVVWGGYHPSLLAGQTVNDPNIDIVARGQGEVTCLELARWLKGEMALEDINGLTFKRDGEVVNNAERAVTDINEFPAMPYDLIDLEKYLEFNRRHHNDN
ncbi:MAG: cobalamin-dependent protein, partial [Actinomycetota bacterium]